MAKHGPKTHSKNPGLIPVVFHIKKLYRIADMKKNIFMSIVIILLILPIMFTSGCKKKKKKLSPVKQLLPGTWYMSKGRAYILLIMRFDGNWSSDVRLEGASSKIVERKGGASGTWHIEDKDLILKVSESKVKEIWEKNKELVCEIVKLDHDFMILRYPNGRVFTWKRAQVKKKGGGDKSINLSPVIRIPPIVVNLNKISSNDIDRYFCLDMELEMNTLLPGEKPVLFRPEAREAAIIFLSSLIYKEVKTFDAVNIVKKKLEKILNPYLEGSLKKIKIKNVMITSSIDKADTFFIEHTPKAPVSGDKKQDKKNAEKS